MNPLTTLKSIPNLITQTGGRSVLLVKKHSPELLLAAGIVGGVTATVMACKATRKVDDVLDTHIHEMSIISMAPESDDKAENKELTKMKARIYANTAKELTKLYLPPIALGLASVSCVLGSHGILTRRNAAIAAAYSVVQDRFNEYRGRVVNEFGEEKDKQLYFGTKQETIETVEVDAKGKEKKTKKIVNVKDPNQFSLYAKIFDDASPNWVNDAEINMAFLRAQQNYCNDLLKTRGHVFLNEVYDILGIPRTQAGSVVGWVLSEDGDNFVDFGLYSIHNQEAMDFVNGYNENIILDFNVDGIIYNLI